MTQSMRAMHEISSLRQDFAVILCRLSGAIRVWTSPNTGTEVMLPASHQFNSQQFARASSTRNLWKSCVRFMNRSAVVSCMTLYTCSASLCAQESTQEVVINRLIAGGIAQRSATHPLLMQRSELVSRLRRAWRDGRNDHSTTEAYLDIIKAYHVQEMSDYLLESLDRKTTMYISEISLEVVYPYFEALNAINGPADRSLLVRVSATESVVAIQLRAHLLYRLDGPDIALMRIERALAAHATAATASVLRTMRTDMQQIIAAPPTGGVPGYFRFQ